MVTVDVVVATRNRADLTQEAVRSVQAQTWADWHLWLVDDGSDDGSADVLSGALAGDARVTLLRQEWRGPEAARQLGLEAGSAPWVALLDSDDLWLPRKLERQLAVADGADVVTCWHSWLRPDGTTRVVRRLHGSGRVPPLWTDNVSTPLVRRQTLAAAGGLGPQPGLPGLTTCEHIDLWVRLSAVARAAVVPEVLVHCRDHDGPRSSDPVSTLRAARELDSVTTARRDILAAWPRDHAELLARTGARFVAAGARSEGYARFARALRVAPGAEKVRLARRYARFLGGSLRPTRGAA
ncbi:MAG: glycosyltransferase family 2 protein [Actinomycetes bacterium]